LDDSSQSFVLDDASQSFVLDDSSQSFVLDDASQSFVLDDASQSFVFHSMVQRFKTVSIALFASIFTKYGPKYLNFLSIYPAAICRRRFSSVVSFKLFVQFCVCLIYLASIVPDGNG
jgi:hypothetical protein